MDLTRRYKTAVITFIFAVFESQSEAAILLRPLLENKKVCYRWLHSASRVKRETRILSIGVGAFRPKFYGNGPPSPAKMLTSFDR